MSLLERVSGFVLRNFGVEQAQSLRSAYMSTKRRLAPLRKRLYGTFDAQALHEHLEQRIGRDFEILMVHGSVNHMLPMYTGTPLQLVQMLEEYCGPSRTLVMPAFFFGDPNIGGVNETFQSNPRFDLRRTPSQMGLFTELFRRSKDVVQSRHPVYRVAAKGPLAEALVEGHEHCIEPAGVGSPFEFMAARDSLVLGIGKSYHVMTQVHHVDSLLGAEFPPPRKPLEERVGAEAVVIDGDQEIPVTLRGSGITWRFNIGKLPSLLEPGQLDCWKFHHVPMFAAKAGVVTQALVAAAKQGKCLYDPV